MVAEVLAHLAPERGGVFVDCTVGLGGHARALLEAGASRIIGLDRDPSAIERSRDALAAFSAQVELVHSDYRELTDVLDARGIGRVDGVLADLGVSSMQLEAPDRGFSLDRKSTRLNSSHLVISYAVFCLKKKIKQKVLVGDAIDLQDVDLLCN